MDLIHLYDSILYSVGHILKIGENPHEFQLIIEYESKENLFDNLTIANNIFSKLFRTPLAEIHVDAINYVVSISYVIELIPKIVGPT